MAAAAQTMDSTVENSMQHEGTQDDQMEVSPEM
jgi:hypothetical protein